MHVNYDDLQYGGISDLKDTFNYSSFVVLIVTMIQNCFLVHLKETMKDIE